MARNKGTFQFAANFEVKAAAALDPRIVVSTKAELISKDTWPFDDDTIYLYKGILVSVQEENAVYMLTDTSKILNTDYSGWLRVDAGNAEQVEVINNLESDSTTAALSAKQGKVLNASLTEVKEKLASVYSVKGSKDYYSDLPTNAAVGDVYNVVNAVLPDMTIELADGSSAKLLNEKVSFEGVTYFMFKILADIDYFLTSEAPETLTVGSKLTYADVYSEAGETFINWGYEQEIVSINNSGKPYPAGTNFVWNGTNWDALGGSVDFSGYYDKEEVGALIKEESDRAKKEEASIWDHADAGVRAAQSAVHLAYGHKEAIDNLSIAVEEVYLDLYGNDDPYTGKQPGYVDRLEAVESLIGNPTAEDKESTMLARLNALEEVVTGGESGGEGEEDQTLLQKVNANTLAISQLKQVVGDNESGLVVAVNTLVANSETVGSVDYKINQAFKWNEVS